METLRYSSFVRQGAHAATQDTSIGNYFVPKVVFVYFEDENANIPL